MLCVNEVKFQTLDEKGFHSPLVSLIRVGTMMLGELDFLGTYLSPLRNLESSTWYQIVAATIFLVAFIILMPILLMNLLASQIRLILLIRHIRKEKEEQNERLAYEYTN